MKSFVRFAVAVISLVVAGAGTATAQFAMPSPDQRDLTIDAAVRTRVIDSLATALEQRYVFPDVAKSTAKALRTRRSKGAYDKITSAKEFADTLTAHLQAVGRDRHFNVHYSERTLPRLVQEDEPPPAEVAKIREQSRFMNHGFNKVQRLAGNVGYIEFRMFDGAPEAGATAAAAMTFLANTDALIIDLRRNGGGDPSMIILLLSYLYGAEERIHVNDFYWREGDRTEQFWTLPNVPGPRYAEKEVFVLTSKRTGSAAEEFSYDIQNLKRGTLIGETTAGAAHPGGMVRLDDHFACFISSGRAISPVTKTNWEGVGVRPDVAVPAEEALKTAHVTAINHLMEKSTDAERKALLARALEQAKNAPIEPLDLGRPAAAPAKSGTGS